MKILTTLSMLAVFTLFTVKIVYSACPGTYYCDNTPAETTRECSIPTRGTYNGSFSGINSYHNWTLVASGTYVRFTASLVGQANDDLDLRVYSPTSKNETGGVGPGSLHSVSICGIGGRYAAEVHSFSVSPDYCAPYNITISNTSVGCCRDLDCEDGLACSLDKCQDFCTHCTQANYNVSTCNNYPCCAGLQMCFDGICRATCPDFSISLNPTSLTILRPLAGINSSTSTINITSINNFNSIVSLSGDWISSVPSGVSFSYNPPSVTPPVNSSNYSVLTVTVSSTASLGTFTLRTYATSGLLNRTVDLTVNVVAPFNFNVSISPTSGTVVQGNWVTTTVNVTLLFGSPVMVTLSQIGCPEDSTCTFSVNPIHPTTSGNTSIFNVSTRPSTPNGTYTITITGTGGGLTRSATYTLTVGSSPVCTRANPVVTISPSLQSGRAGQTLTYTVNVTNKDSTACGESTFSLRGIMPSGQNFSHSFSQSTLVIKPAGFTNWNISHFYVTSNCTSSEGPHTIRVNVTNTNAPSYFALASATYNVSHHFSVSLLDSPYSGVSGSMGSYRVNVTNNKWATCPASNFSLVGLPNSVPSGWSYVLGPSSVILAPGAFSTLMRFNVTSPCSAAPSSYTVRVNVTDNSTKINKTASGTYTVLTPSCYIRSTPFFSFGPFYSTLTATFYNLNTTCFSTATLDCGQGTRVNVPISAGTANTTCFYPSVTETTYYTTRANVSANANVICQTTVVNNPNVFNFSVSVTSRPDYSGLVGFWPFDEGWGISTADKSGYNNNGTLGVTNWEYVPAWTLGKFGHALSFDGLDDYVDVGNSSILNPTEAISVEAWIFTRSYTTFSRVVSKETSIIANPYALELINTTNIKFFIGDGSVETGTPDINVNLIGRWVHVVGTYDRQYIRIYINGELKGQTARTGSILSRTTKVLIGNNPSHNRPFNGTIDEVKIWNRALTEEEVLREYRRGKVPRGGNHYANVAVTLLSGSTQPVSLSVSGCPPRAECTLTPNVSNPTYASLLNISTSSSTPTGTYTLNIRGVSGSMVRSMNYTIEVVGIEVACPIGQCSVGDTCIPAGTCWGHQQVCYSDGQIKSSCGDSTCNCGEDERSCEADCVGVYFKLYRAWNLISLPYKNITGVSGDTCGADKLHFFYYENYTWKKVVGIQNIKGGYSYWTNPEWFTKALSCYINVTVSENEEITLNDLPKLKKGFNTVGAPNTWVKLSELRCINDLGALVPIKSIYYWHVYYKEWVRLSQDDYLKPEAPYYFGYWIYVEEDCKLTI